MHSRPVQAMASDDEPNMIESRRPRGVSTDESTSNNDSWSNYKKWSKELAAKANQKRKAPDNDTLIGNETKRLKLNNDIVSGDDEPNINTRLLRGVLSTDEDSDDDDEPNINTRLLRGVLSTDEDSDDDDEPNINTRLLRGVLSTDEDSDD
eukprot:502434_1